MDNLLANYKRILEVLQSLSENTLLSYQRRKPKLSDLELISIFLTAEYLGIDSENYLFTLLPKELQYKIERSVYNRRKRRLFFHIETLRTKISGLLNNTQTHFIIDSMPLEVCKLSRSNRAKICKEQYDTSPNQGYCASQSMHFYGYKLHAVCSFEGVFHSIDLTKASVDSCYIYLIYAKHLVLTKDAQLAYENLIHELASIYQENEYFNRIFSLNSKEIDPSGGYSGAN